LKGDAPIKVIASYNIKGGVGKTAIAVNLGHCAVAAGYRTLLWDLDEQGGASTILGQTPVVAPRRPRRTYQLKDHIKASAWPSLDLLPADAFLHLLDRHDRPRHLRDLLERMEASYDRVILDCPPTLGIATEQIFELADLIVVPVVPSSLSMTALAQLEAYAESRERPSPELLPVFTMVDRRRRAHRDAIEAAPKRNAIPYASAMERMAAAGRPIGEIAPASAAAKAIASLWKAVEKRFAEARDKLPRAA
jgi:cellulose biosynthesis protein BcsQ